VGASTSRNPKGLHGLYKDSFTFYCLQSCCTLTSHCVSIISHSIVMILWHGEKFVMQFYTFHWRCCSFIASTNLVYKTNDTMDITLDKSEIILLHISLYIHHNKNKNCNPASAKCQQFQPLQKWPYLTACDICWNFVCTA
jgi:hypothetical protein